MRSRAARTCGCRTVSTRDALCGKRLAGRLGRVLENAETKDVADGDGFTHGALRSRRGCAFDVTESENVGAARHDRRGLVLRQPNDLPILCVCGKGKSPLACMRSEHRAHG